MAEEIGLQELLHQVKQELLAQSPDDPVPLFYVEGVELELSVLVRKQGQAGIKVYVVDVGGEFGRERGHLVRVTLRPLYSREEMRRLIEEDPQLGPRLVPTAKSGVVKGLSAER
jgi:hypothetical protein